MTSVVPSDGPKLADNADVLIVGGGPAGLSAALILGRCCRRVLVCDRGQPRNRAARTIHGLLRGEGRSPSSFLEEARRDLARYTTVTVRATGVVNIRREGEGFVFQTADGDRGHASKILLATGLADELPALSGLAELYGTSVHHCLYCDGFEYAGRPVAAYGKGDKGAELALMIKHWTRDVVVVSDGTSLSADAASRLNRHGIEVRKEPLVSLVQENGRLSAIRFQSGADLKREALFFSTGCHQASDLPERLGCKRDEKGGVIIDSITEETSVPGVYAAGDVSRDVLLVAVAVGEGAKAAVAINKALLRSDGLS